MLIMQLDGYLAVNFTAWLGKCFEFVFSVNFNIYIVALNNS